MVILWRLLGGESSRAVAVVGRRVARTLTVLHIVTLHSVVVPGILSLNKYTNQQTQLLSVHKCCTMSGATLNVK